AVGAAADGGDSRQGRDQGGLTARRLYCVTGAPLKGPSCRRIEEPEAAFEVEPAVGELVTPAVPCGPRLVLPVAGGLRGAICCSRSAQAARARPAASAMTAIQVRRIKIS